MGNDLPFLYILNLSVSFGWDMTREALFWEEHADVLEASEAVQGLSFVYISPIGKGKVLSVFAFSFRINQQGTIIFV